MEQYAYDFTRLRSCACDVESVVVHLQLDEAENVGGASAVAKSLWSPARPGEKVQPRRG